MGCLGFSSLAEVYVYAACVSLGVALLMPLNALTSAPLFMVNYYKYVTGDPNTQPSSKVVWENILTFYNVASVGTQILCGPTVLIPCIRRLSLTLRFTVAILLMMVEVFAVVLMPVTHVSQTSALAAFFIVTIAAGAGKSYLEATTYAMVGTMPPKFMSAVMFGCGCSGVITSVIQCIVKASMPDTYESNLTQSHIYFSLALALMALALLLVLSLRWNAFAQKYVGEFRAAKRVLPPAGEMGQSLEPIHAELPVRLIGERESAVDGTEPGSPLNGENNNREVFGNIVLDEPENTEEAAKVKKENLSESSSEEERVEAVATEGEQVEDQQNMTTAEQMQRTRIVPIIKLIYPCMISCFCVFFVSLFIFPSLVIPIDRVDNWFSTIAILLYNCGDAVGRISSSFRFLWPSRLVLLAVSFVRFIFIALIFLCIYHYIPGFAPPYVFMALIGLTNGFFGATSMVFGPNTPGVETEGQRVMAGQLMGLSLLAGSSVASLLALLVVFFIS